MRLRSDERIESNIATVARIPATGVEVEVVNVSDWGCRIATPNSGLQVGATILVRLTDQDEVAGQIVWVHRKQCGVRFNSAVSDEVLDEIVLNMG